MNLTEEQQYIALTSGYRWVAGVGPNSEEIRTLVLNEGLNRRLDEANPEAPICQLTPLDIDTNN